MIHTALLLAQMKLQISELVIQATFGSGQMVELHNSRLSYVTPKGPNTLGDNP